jgi:crotonobetainyl-CoA:carnitine CoA-transferase CaiB-like acyl-CoA transferase
MRPVLEGIRIADFSHVMAGPYATHLLRLLGAEVIKIEAPARGDAMRSYGTDRRYDGMAPAFIAVNAGKKSMVLDLKQPEDLAHARALVSRCDVLVENFRPGVMRRLGLDHEVARKLNPGIVYCSVSGYGQSGPRRDWPAIDNIVQATSGMMSLGGDPDGPPMRVGFPVVDTLTGQTAAFAILAALLRRERTGEGDYIDVAMFDATIAFMASAVVPWLVTGRALERTGNTGYSGQPTASLFEARDGHRISLGVVQQHQFELLAKLLDMPQWLTDPRFRDPDTRRQNAPAVHQALAEVLRTRAAAEWEQLLSAAGIPCGMVRDIGEAMSLPALEERNLRIPLHIPGLAQREDVAVLGPGFVSSQAGRTTLGPPPRLGEHTAEILAWLAKD